MIVAAGGGGRDLDVDAAIWSARADARSGALNERLMNDLPLPCSSRRCPSARPQHIDRPSGSSLTFMGEEAVGVDAVRIARPKIASGQSEIALIGAAHNGQRKEMPMLYEMRRLQSQKGLHVGLVASIRQSAYQPWPQPASRTSILLTVGRSANVVGRSLKSVPRAVIDLRRITPGDSIIVCRLGQRTLFPK
jgi:3-oxoacyl-(acyl-carrier-protein) synthase